jgi:1-acyl-sn-glycerol-3-phosphate acyltransferase
VLWTLIAMPVQAMMLPLPIPVKAWTARFYWLGVARILGLKLRVLGDRATTRPVLYVANHSSWLDIVALGAVLPGCFVAKGDVAQWPVVSWIARLGRSIFVSRNKATVAREQKQLRERLARGDNIILFPEGTTSDGSRVLPFAAAFLTLADAPAKPCVQPVTLVYDEMEGLPVRAADRPEIAWYGDMDLAPHFWQLAKRGSLRATIILDPPIPPGRYPNRKALSAALELRIAANAAALRQGRQPECCCL